MYRITIVAVLTLLSPCLSNLFASPNREVHLKWIHTSDVHASLFQYDYLKKHNVSGGLSAIYAYVQEQRKEHGVSLKINGRLLAKKTMIKQIVPSMVG